jgi:hypothetical protein
MLSFKIEAEPSAPVPSAFKNSNKKIKIGDGKREMIDANTESFRLDIE